MKALASFAMMIAALTCNVVAAATTPSIVHYRVAPNSALSQLDVEVCVPVEAALALQQESRSSSAVIESLRFFDGERERRIEWNGRRINVPRAPDAAAPRCVRYAVRLHAESLGRDQAVSRIGRDVLTTPAAWMLSAVRTDAVRGSERLQQEVEFLLPQGIAVSVPWHPLDAGSQRYRIAPSAPGGWDPLVAFGHFKVRQVEVAGAQFQVAVLDGNPVPNVDELVRWVRETAGDVAGIYGRYPEPFVQVVLVPTNGQRSRWWPARAPPAVGFGRVLRSGGAAAQFFVNQTSPIADYYADWTATHEFSHLLLPFIAGDGSWVSEGFASYYQNVLMARAGRYSAERAWQKLHEGFLRGAGDGSYDATLQAAMQASCSWRDRRTHGPCENLLMRKYWSGAAVALLGDVELRRRSGGKQSLDTVLGRLADCCLPSDRVWSALEFFAKLDELSGMNVFVPLCDTWVNSTSFPDVAPVYEQLGLVADGRSLRVRRQGPLVNVRERLMANTTAIPSGPSSER